jgi:hypothetical protein
MKALKTNAFLSAALVLAGAVSLLGGLALPAVSATTQLAYPAGSYTAVSSANAAGTIVGSAFFKSPDPTAEPPVPGSVKALVWRAGSYNAFEELPLPKGFRDARAFAINDAGLIVGTVYDMKGSPSPVTWSGGAVALLPTLGGRGSAFDVSTSGVIVGSVASPKAGTKAAVWQAGKLTVLPDFGFGNAEARAIGDDGIIYGVADTPDMKGNKIPVRWVNGAISALPTSLGANTAGPAAIWGASSGFAAGTTVITEEVPGAGSFPRSIAIAWENGAFRMLERPTGRGNSYVGNVNSAGQFAGSVQNEVGVTTPVVWTKEGVSLLAPGRGSNTIATVITDNGLVAGINRSNPSEWVPVIWNLAEEPLIAMSDVTAAPGATVVLRANATMKGKPQPNQIVSFSANDKPIGTALTNSKGEAVMSFAAPAQAGVVPVGARIGNSPITVRSVIVGSSPSVATLTPVTGRSGQRVIVSASLRLSLQNTALAGKQLSFVVNGRVVARAKTDASGVARARIVLPKVSRKNGPQTVPIEVRFTGDTVSSATTGSATAYVVPR